MLQTDIDWDLGVLLAWMSSLAASEREMIWIVQSRRLNAGSEHG